MQVKLSYFRNSGKKFGGSQYNTEKTTMSEIINEVRGFKINKSLPETKEIDVIVLAEATVEGNAKAHLVI